MALLIDGCIFGGHGEGRVFDAPGYYDNYSIALQ